MGQVLVHSDWWFDAKGLPERFEHLLFGHEEQAGKNVSFPLAAVLLAQSRPIHRALP